MRLLYHTFHAKQGTRVPDTPLAPCMMEQLGTTWSFSKWYNFQLISSRFCMVMDSQPGKQEGSLFAQPQSLGYAHCCSNVNVYEGCNKILN